MRKRCKYCRGMYESRQGELHECPEIKLFRRTRDALNRCVDIEVIKEIAQILRVEVPPKYSPPVVYCSSAPTEE